MASLKEVYFIFDIHLQKPEVFCKLFQGNQNFISVAESNKFSPRTKILLLSITISKALYKRRLFRYAILIHKKKQWKFWLSHQTKHYSSIFEEKYLVCDLKSETFESTRGSLIIQKNSNSQP